MSSALTDLLNTWKQTESNLKDKDNWRILTKVSPSEKGVFDFSSNDYLSLRFHAKIIEGGYRNALKYGAGAGASRSVWQTDGSIQELEDKFCQYTQFSKAILFQSGFIANLAFFESLTPMLNEENKVEIFLDHNAHTSLYMAVRQCKIPYKIFRHQDFSFLEDSLKKSSSVFKLIVVESLYSMDGHFIDVLALTSLCEKYDAFIYLDEGHSFGIYGKNGNGFCNLYPKFKERIFAAMFGCGKALGVSGGFLAIQQEHFYDRIFQKSKFFIYSTGISPFITGSLNASLNIISSKEGDVLRSALKSNILFFIKAIKKSSASFLLKETPESGIIPLIIGENLLTQNLSYFLEQSGFIIKSIRPPSVAKGSARLRLSLHAALTEKQIVSFVEILSLACDSYY